MRHDYAPNPWRTLPPDPHKDRRDLRRLLIAIAVTLALVNVWLWTG